LARLTVALGLLQNASPAETAEYASRIGVEAERLDKMIGQLLTLTRIDSGVEFTRRETFDLTDLVHEVAADGDFEARARNREVKVMHADSCTMNGFPEMLRSAIENVVRNAIRFAPVGTAVEISLQRSASTNQDNAVLKIRDHGPGVSPRLVSEIFKPFHRAAPDNNANGQGAGLGLAIADRVVQRHDGTISAYNASDGGLVVEIVLPING
jgi:two-component system sensor histidine kinase CpxA